jgi:hypothetical protein
VSRPWPPICGNPNCFGRIGHLSADYCDGCFMETQAERMLRGGLHCACGMLTVEEVVRRRLGVGAGWTHSYSSCRGDNGSKVARLSGSLND